MNTNSLIKLGTWIFDPQAATLKKPGEEPLPLESKLSCLLMHLIDNKNMIVSREELIKTVWQGRYVEDLTINATISRLRKIFGGKTQEYIKTHPKKGYSLICDISYIERSEMVVPVVKSTKTSKTTILAFIKSHRNYIFLAALVSITAVLLFITLSPLSKEHLKNQMVVSTPLTYIEGLSFAPSLSGDGEVLAFTNLKSKNLSFQVIVQDLDTKQTKNISDSEYSSTPYWDLNSEYLYFQTYQNDTCNIKRKRYLNKPLEFGVEEIITNCGNVRNMSPIAIDNNSEWLYFSYQTDKKTPFIIKKYNLNSQKEEIITFSNVKSYGDFSLSLSPDNRKLALLRAISGKNIELLYLDLNSGKEHQLKVFNHIVYKVAWTKNSQEIVYIDNDKSINLMNISSKNNIVLYQSFEHISSPSLISNENILVSTGDSLISNILEINLLEEHLELKPLITSSFDDFGADIYQHTEKEMIGFISNRSGNSQVWLKYGESLIQLTDFTKPVSLSNIQFSADGKEIIYVKDQKMFILNIASKQSRDIFQLIESVKSPVWSCTEKDIAYISMLNGKSWDLFKLNVIKGTKEKLIVNVDNIKSDCDSNQYFISRSNKNAVYQFDPEDNKVETEQPMLADILLNSYKWTAFKNHLYYIHKNVLFKFDIQNKNTTALMEIESFKNGIRITNGRMIFNQTSLNNTHISRIPIKTE